MDEEEEEPRERKRDLDVQRFFFRPSSSEGELLVTAGIPSNKM